MKAPLDVIIAHRESLIDVAAMLNAMGATSLSQSILSETRPNEDMMELCKTTMPVVISLAIIAMDDDENAALAAIMKRAVEILDEIRDENDDISDAVEKFIKGQ